MKPLTSRDHSSCAPRLNISNRGRRILELLETKPAYASIIQAELCPLTAVEWGRSAGGTEIQKPQLSGNDYRLLFAVYDNPGTLISNYEDAIDAPARSNLLERAQRLEKMGLIHVLIESNELDIPSKGRDIVGPIKAVADQVYRRDQR